MSNPLRPKIIRILISQALYHFALGIFNIFFSIFLWDQTKGLKIIGLFGLFFILTHAVSFHLSAKIIKKGNAHIIRALGLVGRIFLFLILFFNKELIVDWIIPIAIFNGMLTGMFWMSANAFRFDLTNKTNRGKYQGTSKALQIAVGILAPIVGGSAIYFNFLGFGYGNIFLIGSILLLAALFIGYIKIPNNETRPLHVYKTLKVLKKFPDIKKVMVSKLVGNIGYKGAMEKLVPVFIFVVLQNEFQVGNWMSIFSLAAVIITFSFGKYMPYHYYKQSILIASSVLFISVLFLAGIPSLLTYIIYGLVRQVCIPLIQIPTNVYFDNLIHEIPDYEEHKTEIFVIREWSSIALSRTVGFTILIFVPNLSGLYMQIFLGIMAIGIIIEPLVMWSIKTKLTKT